MFIQKRGELQDMLMRGMISVEEGIHDSCYCVRLRNYINYTPVPLNRPTNIHISYVFIYIYLNILCT